MKFKYVFLIVIVLGMVWGWSGIRLIEHFEINPATSEDLIPADLRPTDVGCGDCYYSMAGKILLFPSWVIAGDYTYMYGGPNAVSIFNYFAAAIIGSVVLSAIAFLVWLAIHFRQKNLQRILN